MTSLNCLQNTSLFAELEHSELSMYIHPEDYKECTFPADTLIAHQGEHCHQLAYIIDGDLIAQQLATDGKQLTVNQFSSNDFFAAAILSADTPCYPFNISTTSSTRILYIDYSAIENLLNHSITFSANYRHFLSEKIMMFKDKVELLQYRDVRSRLLTYLQNESLYHQSPTFRLRHTKTAIADMIGVARPSVSRELKHMIDDGLVRVEGKWVELL